jgi:hypothetical protein
MIVQSLRHVSLSSRGTREERAGERRYFSNSQPIVAVEIDKKMNIFI